MINARAFLDEIADMLRAKGRTVEVTVTEENFGTFVWLYAPPQHWYERSINLSAAKSNRPGSRWALGKLQIGSSAYSKKITATTRSDIRIAADVYGN